MIAMKVNGTVFVLIYKKRVADREMPRFQQSVVLVYAKIKQIGYCGFGVTTWNNENIWQ